MNTHNKKMERILDWCENLSKDCTLFSELYNRLTTTDSGWDELYELSLYDFINEEDFKHFAKIEYAGIEGQ